MKLEEIYQNVIDGNAQAAEAGVRAALAEGTDANTILQQALIRAMGEVGRRFEEGEYYVPEMLLLARVILTGSFDGQLMAS